MEAVAGVSVEARIPTMSQMRWTLEQEVVEARRPHESEPTSATLNWSLVALFRPLYRRPPMKNAKRGRAQLWVSLL